ncbi:cytochrome P450 [Protomyces lactucae-debilis]|uniref:Cytochrome P450 n=1 Tax=Protomyces lactucae-debilis TaxID=2754530 RepID=A0A1Y2ES65_PROLT|nr:cytochrome P450 [Protomyces lactucae-debilis]ORY74124.1 cytochrome P450 [Protomyces lactucae-debilis]
MSANVTGSFPPVSPSGGIVSRLLDGINGWTLILSAVAVILVAEQVRYRNRKQGIAGPAFTIPIMGAFLDSMHPTFEGYFSKWESGALSCVSVFHKFVVIASTKDLSRKILNSPMYVQPCVVDAAKKILMKTNWVFLDGKPHVEYRKGLNTLFTRKSLALYIPEQMAVYERYFAEFLKLSEMEPVAFMPHFRDLNVAVSCRTFFGYWIKDSQIKQISEDYWYITAAMELVNFPLALPYTKVWYGIRARKTVIAAFEEASASSRKAMLAGEKPTCMVDQWIVSMIEAQKFAKSGGDKADMPASVLIRDFSDNEIAQTMLSFLFASQDATSSAMSWLFHLLADNPDIYGRIRQEQLDVRGGDPSKAVDMEMYDQMTLTKAAVRETLRLRPPVLMVPYQAKKDWNVTPEYKVPKGAMVIPTFWHALHDEQAFPDPHAWVPERWISGTANASPQNWLVFGVGPHHCLGQAYAMEHLALAAGLACLKFDLTHHKTEVSENIKIFATIFPEDDVVLSWRKSEHHC